MNLVRNTLLGAIGFVAGGLVWSTAIEPYWIDETTYRVTIPHLPSQWQGKAIALLADPQQGIWLDNRVTVHRAIERVVARRPALVLLAGDFVYGGSQQIEKSVTAMGALVRRLPEAGLPTYAVLGNHDYRSNEAPSPLAQRVQATLCASGCGGPHPRRTDPAALLTVVAVTYVS